MKFPVKIRDIRKIDYENKEKHPIYLSKNCYEGKHVNLFLTGAEGKRHYFLNKDFNTFKYDHTLLRGKSIFVVIVYKLLVQKKY